ncbi:tetratricopeptide (TPR) repeat protein [Azospirillum agricola]|uniref:tetratricopeptide repeat protein n=1 Tax=Azospirillum agricola TaxID=1720247 RepID=UPI001AE213D3|nr:tetratricopeptide repeat protein [Azospirillum agricola]MBP2232914.1 tetratricopeptide (TPR) repeat protein [Azospirillum agricola]
MTKGTAMPSGDAESGPEAGISQDIVQRWREAIRRDTFGNYHHQMGVALLAQGERAPALAAFERAVATDPRRFSSARNLAHLLVDDGQPDRARAVLEHARAHDPAADTLALVEDADDAFDAGKVDQAIALMREALAVGAQAAAHRPDSFVKLAGELRNRDRLDEALQWCDLAAPHAQDLGHLHYQRGLILMTQGRHDEAEREARAAILAAPERTAARFLLGHYLRIGLELDAALEFYGQVRDSSDPMRLWAGLMTAYTLLLAGRPGEAMAACEAVRLLDPGFAWVAVYRGLTHLAMDSFEKAAVDFEEGSRHLPDYMLPRLGSGILKIAQGRFREALDDLPDQTGDLNNLALGRLGRALALLGLGEVAEADQLIRKALAEEQLLIAVSLRLLGRHGEALGPLLSAAGYRELMGNAARHGANAS